LGGFNGPAEALGVEGSKGESGAGGVSATQSGVNGTAGGSYTYDYKLGNTWYYKWKSA
jgi:hypothetical protein